MKKSNTDSIIELILVLIIGTVLSIICLTGCNQGTINVEAREYVGGVEIERDSWKQASYPATAGKVIFSDKKYNLSVTLTSVTAKDAVLSFSTPIFCTTTEMATDVYRIERGRTYNFATSNMAGIEVKIRYQ